MPIGDFTPYYGQCLNCLGGKCTYCFKQYNTPIYYYTTPVIRKEIIEKFDEMGKLIERITRDI